MCYTTETNIMHVNDISIKINKITKLTGDEAVFISMIFGAASRKLKPSRGVWWQSGNLKEEEAMLRLEGMQESTVTQSPREESHSRQV